MRLSIPAATVAALLLASTTVFARDIDMRGFTCSDFEQLNHDNPKAAETMIVWLVGWYSGYGETYKFGDGDGRGSAAVAEGLQQERRCQAHAHHEGLSRRRIGRVTGGLSRPRFLPYDDVRCVADSRIGASFTCQ
jgi:hypothetical protein